MRIYVSLVENVFNLLLEEQVEGILRFGLFVKKESVIFIHGYIVDCIGSTFRVYDNAVSFVLDSICNVVQKAFLTIKVNLELWHETDVGISGCSYSINCQKSRKATWNFDQDDRVIVGGSQSIPFVNKLLSFLNSWLKTKTVVKVSNILVDSFKTDTESNVEFSVFDLFVKLSCIFYGDVSTNEVQMIDSSSLQRVNNLLGSAFGSRQAEITTSFMMNSFHHIGSQI